MFQDIYLVRFTYTAKRGGRSLFTAPLPMDYYYGGWFGEQLGLVGFTQAPFPPRFPPMLLVQRGDFLRANHVLPFASASTVTHAVGTAW